MGGIATVEQRTLAPAARPPPRRIRRGRAATVPVPLANLVTSLPSLYVAVRAPLGYRDRKMVRGHSNAISRQVRSARPQGQTASLSRRDPMPDTPAPAPRPQARPAGSDCDPPHRRVLFVCLGNICRSPTAEAVFRAAVEQRGLAARYDVDSCGTGGGSHNWYKKGGSSYHEGDPADSRMTRAAADRKIILTSRSRPLTRADLADSTVVVVMDRDNAEAVERAAAHWGGECPALVVRKVRQMSQWYPEKWSARYDSVPDPYYGGRDGFDLVLDLLGDACAGLLDDLEGGRMDDA